MKKHLYKLIAFIVFQLFAFNTFSQNISTLLVNNKVVEEIRILSDSIDKRPNYSLDSVKLNPQFSSIASYNREVLTKLVFAIKPTSQNYVPQFLEPYQYCGLLAEKLILASSLKIGLQKELKNYNNIDYELAVNNVSKLIQNIIFDGFYKNGIDLKKKINYDYCKQKTYKDVKAIIGDFLDIETLQEYLLFILINNNDNIFQTSTASNP